MNSVLIPVPMRRAMVANWRWNAARKPNTDDLRPVVKLFTPAGGCTWLLSELDPDDNDTCFGLCDLGMGEPELGNVSLRELATVRNRLGLLAVERDRYVNLDKPLSVYTAWARFARRIVTTKPEGFA